MKTLATLFLCMISVLLSGQNSPKRNPHTAGQLIQTIIDKTGADKIPGTVDVIKEGNPDTPVTGIASCMFATMDVLKEAVSMGCNFIVTHEPLYYNHLDETTRFVNDPVMQEKRKYILDHHLVIWRFHDYYHAMKPDGIQEGMAEKLGWKKYSVNHELKHFILPETSLEALVQGLKKIFPGNTINVVGRPELKVTNVWLQPGAPGTEGHVLALENKDADVLITGESPQWETYEYARDAMQQGRNKAVIFLGHIPSEDYGMDFCVRWLKTFIQDIPIHFIECGPSFRTY